MVVRSGMISEDKTLLRCRKRQLQPQAIIPAESEFVIKQKCF